MLVWVLVPLRVLVLVPLLWVPRVSPSRSTPSHQRQQQHDQRHHHHHHQQQQQRHDQHVGGRRGGRTG